MRLPQPLLRGRLVRRYKRFLADVRLDSGEVLTVHCPNSGSMTGLDRPGLPALVSDSGNPRRKLRHTLERVRPGRAWVGVNTMLPNHVVREALERGRVPELRGYDEVRGEVAFSRGTRLDLRLTSELRPPCWVEVKNATLRDGRLARFPDAVTERGRKHVEALRGVARRGTGRAVLFFLVNRADCDALAPADDIDPEYGRALRRAARSGVEILAYRARLRPGSVSLGARLPVSL